MADVQRQDWTAEQYFADDSTSRSGLWDFSESARMYHGRYVTRTIPPREQTASMRLGTLVHLRVLEPDVFRRTIFVKPPGLTRKSNAGKAELDRIEREGLLAVDLDDAQAIESMAAAVFAHRRARNLIEASEHEVTLTWTDTDTELAAGPMNCRARLDMLAYRPGRALIGDLKTADDPADDAFAKHGARLGYHWQPPFYAAPVLEMLGVVPGFCFVVVRNRPPFEVAVYDVEPTDVEAAAVQVRHAMRRLSKCIASNKWSSTWERPAKKLKFPGWALQPPKEAP